MFDIASTEFVLVLLIALVVIGPKDLPKVLRVVGKWVGKARQMVAQLRSGFDDMIRETELAEMEKKWQEENDRIMKEHPNIEADSSSVDGSGDDPAAPSVSEKEPELPLSAKKSPKPKAKPKAKSKATANTKPKTKTKPKAATKAKGGGS